MTCESYRSQPSIAARALSRRVGACPVRAVALSSILRRVVCALVVRAARPPVARPRPPPSAPLHLRGICVNTSTTQSLWHVRSAVRRASSAKRILHIDLFALTTCAHDCVNSARIPPLATARRSCARPGCKGRCAARPSILGSTVSARSSVVAAPRWHGCVWPGGTVGRHWDCRPPVWRAVGPAQRRSRRSRHSATGRDHRGWQRLRWGTIFGGLLPRLWTA